MEWSKDLTIIIQTMIVFSVIGATLGVWKAIEIIGWVATHVHVRFGV